MSKAAEKSPGGEHGIVTLDLVGHLTLQQLRASLSRVGSELATGTTLGLLVDCQRMTGYDTEARGYFVDWNKRMHGKFRRLAVVTERTMWHLVVSGMALASGQAMKGFSDLAAAQAWLRAEK